MNDTKSIQAAFDKIHQIALKGLANSTLSQETKLAFEEIVALARYQFDISQSRP